MDLSASDAQALAPGGRLRAAINVGNPILARLDPVTGRPAGVSVDLAARLATLLGASLELMVFDAAGKSVEGVAADEADCGFFAVDPKRGEAIAFTAPYVLIEGCYLVRKDSPIRDNGEVDQAGLTVVVGKGSAYDLFLTRELARATILRAPTSPSVVDTFMESGADGDPRADAGRRRAGEEDLARLAPPARLGRRADQPGSLGMVLPRGR